MRSNVLSVGIWTIICDRRRQQPGLLVGDVTKACEIVHQGPWLHRAGHETVGRHFPETTSTSSAVLGHGGMVTPSTSSERAPVVRN
jgi:hypothetical protein